MALRDRITAYIRDGKTSHAVQATIQGGTVKLTKPDGRDVMYLLSERNSLGDPVRTLYVHKDEVQAIVSDTAPKKKK